VALSKDQDPLDQTSDTDIPHVISIASYDTADDENPEPTWDPETTPWIVAVASALEWLDPSEMI
jgi:hypothetical protein